VGTGVTYDDLADAVASMLSLSPGPDGRYTWQPKTLSATLTGRKHIADAAYVIADSDVTLGDGGWEIMSADPDLVTITLDSTTFHLPRNQVADVNQSQQDMTRTVSVELVSELTLDVSVEYRLDDPDA
jgi:hypothetical protein